MWPGGEIEYSVWVWSTENASKVSATIGRSNGALLAPIFSLCPAARGATCSIGSLPANQAFELLITDHIAKSASVGQELTMTVGVQGASLSPAEASIAVILGQHGSSPAPVVTVPGGVTVVPGLPGTTVTPGSINSLFPVVTPQATPSPRHARPQRKIARAITTASSLPLDPRLIGGQLVGLAVLAAAITMVVARLSLRAPQPAAPTGEADAAPPAEPVTKLDSPATN